MKNASVYEKKLRKLLGGLPKGRAEAWASSDPIRVLIESILEPDTFGKQASAAAGALMSEFVDYNEMRVSPIKDIVETVGRDYPDARVKAETLVKVLNTVFDRTCQMTMEYMAKMPKKELRKHLLAMGLGPYSAACVLLLYGGGAIPVDRTLVDCLVMEDLVPAKSTIEEVQPFLERLVGPKDSLGAHELLRTYVEKNAKAIAKKRKDDEAAAKAKALAEEQAAQEKKAREEAAAAAAAEKKAAREAKAARGAEEHAAKTKKAEAAKAGPKKK